MSAPESASPLDRFEFRRRLGSGGFGVVFDAFDRQRGATVALKLLRNARPSSLFHFKREFRSLADVMHDNLVQLYELSTDGEVWFFTMELVRGVDFLDWVRPPGPSAYAHSTTRTAEAPIADTVASDAIATAPTEMAPISSVSAPDTAPAGGLRVERLERAMRQLARGLAALHAAGKLHRDIKPSNVLVTPEGRLVILDFGLVADLGPDGRFAGKSVAGTPGYMAPEQLAGDSATPATDWYSVGALLYEALTGLLPAQAQLKHGLTRELEPPRSGHRHLDELAMALLEFDPEKRPNDSEVLRRLGESPSADLAKTHVFVGRSAELDLLREHCRGPDPAIAIVRGGSGLGKTALAQEFLDELEGEGGRWVVLRGRCYEQESVPFKALDGIVDALSDRLALAPPDQVARFLPPNVRALSRLFPVLESVPAIAGAPALGVVDNKEIQRLAVEALRELLRRLSEAHSIVWFIDDVQWGDGDSAFLLERVWAPPTPKIFLLATCRSEPDADNPLIRALETIGANDDVAFVDRALAPLPADDALELARKLVPGDETRAAALVAEAQGNPFFLDVLAARSDTSGGVGALESVLLSRIAELSDASQRLLQMVAIAGHPLSRALLREAAELEAGDVHAVRVLRTSRLIRARGSESEGELEPYHDRIREAVARAIPPEEKARRHARLARVIDASESPDPELLSVHYEAAGERAPAARYTAMAARAAFDALAFDRAARLFSKALELDADAAGGERALRVALGDAFTNLGRGALAADEYRRAALLSDPREALDLRRRAAEHLLNAGHIEQGLEVLDTVLGAVGMKLPSTPRAALASLTARRIRIALRGLDYLERTEQELSAERLLAADACFSVASGLGVVDTVRAAGFQAKNLLLSLDLGEPSRVARALTMEVAFVSTIGPKKHARTEELIAKTRTLVDRLDDERAVARIVLTSGIAAFHEGAWRRAQTRCAEAERHFRENCTGIAFELHNAEMYGLRSLYYLGRWRDVARLTPEKLADAEARGDLFAMTRIQSWGGYVADLARDDPETAREAVRRVMARWAVTTPHQVWYRVAAETEILLYEGDSERAHRMLSEHWAWVERSLQLRIQAARMIALYLHGRVLLAEARRTKNHGFWREIERDCRQIVRAKTGWADPLAALLRAGVAAQKGQTERAIELCARAEDGARTADMLHVAEAARHRRGELTGGDAGRELVEAARAFWRAQAFPRPDRLFDISAPGFPRRV